MDKKVFIVYVEWGIFINPIPVSKKLHHGMSFCIASTKGIINFRIVSTERELYRVYWPLIG